MTKRNGESERREGVASGRLRELAAQGRADGGIEVGRAISVLGQAGTSLVALLLTLPTLMPVPGPFGMVFGTPLANGRSPNRGGTRDRLAPFCS
ncbi:exopolysaccharide biosynthesis protein [Rhizobium croatiense]|uniref:exopolysaccharide biosynthesis protein n=1 Tax=Rhizobium croatiense TaxID=2867516 RepID=UPI0024849F7F|nr:exopolysaccharide biosynthesis protein [Rhizobium croatiense]